MWIKMILLACAVFIAGLIFSVFHEQDQEQSVALKPALTRSATSVVMIERRKDGSRTMEVSARSVEETGNQLTHLKDYRLRLSNGASLDGKDAFYDSRNSMVKMVGPIGIMTKDGDRATLKDLTWDRNQHSARTENPVRLEGENGIITADRAEFEDDFATVAFIGNVHAKIHQNILNH